MISRRAHNRSGQAAVEMALVLPVLLLLVIGILEFGQAWHVKQVVTDAAREGARLAVVFNPETTQDSVRTAIKIALGRAGVDSSNMEIAFDTLSPPGGHWRETGAMQTVSVQCQFQFGFFGPIFQAIFGSDEVTISSVVSMRNE
jgi:Flp pilus assembly protein TadG